MTDDDEKQSIRELIDTRNDAVARGDAEAVIAPLAEDVVSYDLPPPLSYEGAAARDVEGLRQWMATFDGPVRVEMPDPTITIDDEVAVVWGLSRMRGDKKEQGEIDIWSRTTLVLARRGDGWKVIHEHNSYPMLMDGSGLAALELKPEDSKTSA